MALLRLLDETKCKVIYWAICPSGGIFLTSTSWTRSRTVSSSWEADRFLSSWTGVEDIWSVV